MLLNYVIPSDTKHVSCYLTLKKSMYRYFSLQLNYSNSSTANCYW